MNRLSPEGETWIELKSSEEGDSELLSVSVGPAGLIWAVTWSGDALGRTGVTHQHIMGKYSAANLYLCLDFVELKKLKKRIFSTNMEFNLTSGYHCVVFVSDEVFHDSNLHLA